MYILRHRRSRAPLYTVDHGCLHGMKASAEQQHGDFLLFLFVPFLDKIIFLQALT